LSESETSAQLETVRPQEGCVVTASVLAGRPSEPVWTDRKRHLWLLGIVAMTLPLQSALLYRWSGWPVFWWFAPLFIDTLLPLADWVLGGDPTNPPDGLVADRGQTQKAMPPAECRVRWISQAWALRRTLCPCAICSA
jgi:hypothetical protein